MNLENNKTLLVGLWNPQSKYLRTRHNIGADILEKFCIKNSVEVKLDKSGSFKIGQATIENSKAVNVEPLNKSINKNGTDIKVLQTEIELLKVIIQELKEESSNPLSN